MTFDGDRRECIDGDRRIILSAVSNLLRNALKFTRNGGKVTARIRRVEENVFFEVEDECGGLPKT